MAGCSKDRGRWHSDAQGRCAAVMVGYSGDVRVVLFHHVQGMTPGVRALADRLRAGGHVVDTPDLFEGRTFGSIGDGQAYLERVGMAAIVERGVAAAGAGRAVYAGISLGAMPAQKLAQTRPLAAGCLLFHSAVPVEAFGREWPKGLPLQVHASDHDPYEDLDAVKATVADASGELCLYVGRAHVFTDESLPDFNPAATSLAVSRALAFISRAQTRVAAG